MPEPIAPPRGRQLLVAVGLAAMSAPLFWTWATGFALVAARQRGSLPTWPAPTDLALLLQLPGVAGHAPRALSWPEGSAAVCALLALLTTTLTVRAFASPPRELLPSPRLRLTAALSCAAGILLASDSLAALLRLISGT